MDVSLIAPLAVNDTAILRPRGSASTHLVDEPLERHLDVEVLEAELLNLREYVERGGFILIDDFDSWHMDNLREEMRRVFPERAFERLNVENPIFDLVYEVESLVSMAPHVPGGDTVYYGLTNSMGQIAIVALHNNDFANFWEWYGTPNYPLRPSTDAFRMGTNFVVHSMTH